MPTSDVEVLLPQKSCAWIVRPDDVHLVHIVSDVLLERCWPPVGFRFNVRLWTSRALVRILTANCSDPKGILSWNLKKPRSPKLFANKNVVHVSVT